MPIILSNITRLSDSTVQSFFNKFWATPIFMYVSSVYTFCLVIICVCLYFNRRNNLIYKVLNLAVLSVFVVALWSYLTDVTFIYVVYILTFVSAVVMLFLSVVLMLPSSAVAVPKKSVSYIIFILFTDGSTIFYGASFTAAALAIYTLLAFYTKSEQPFSGAVTFSVDMSGLNAEQLAKSKNLTENCVYTVANGQSSQSMFLAPVKFDYLNNRLSIRGYSGTYPVYLATNKIFLKHLFLQNRYARMLFQPMCEFLIRAIHLYRAKNSLLFRLPQLIHNYDVELFSVMAQNGVSIYLNGDRQKEIILVSNKPWWSPFVVFPKLDHYVRTTIKLQHLNISMDSTDTRPVNFFLVWPIKYVFSFFFKLLNTLFTYSKAVFNLASNFLKTRTIIGASSVSLEILAQTATAWSIFLVALPSSQFRTYKWDFSAAVRDYQTSSSGLENLANIQYELYVGSPLLMLVCVVGLLVALIGAALLVSTKILNSK